MIDPICDWSPLQVDLKAPQIGYTIMKMLKAFYAASELELAIGYTFPTRDFASELVAEKADKLITNNPVIARSIGKKNDVFQKDVGKRSVAFRGTFGETEGIASTIDILMHDELNQSNQKRIELYESRLQFSKYKGRWLWSNPTTPNVGVGKFWKISDQMHWFITCPHCGHKSYLDWFAGRTKGKRNHTIDRKLEIYICGVCRKELSDDSRRFGEWIAKYPKKYKNGKGWRGRWYSLLFMAWVPASEIMEKFRTKSKEYFYNMVLGLSYMDEAVLVDRGVIFSSYNSDQNSLTNMAMGVDSGLDKHYIVGNQEGIVEVGVKETWEEILTVRNKYQAVCVIDSGPDITEPRRFIQALPGIFYLANYQRDKARQGNVRFGAKDKGGWVYIDRNRTIQEIMEMWVEKRIRISIRPLDLDSSFIKHYENMARIKDVDSLGRDIYKWEAGNGEDHFVHATVYWRAALDRIGQKSCVVSPSGGIVESGIEIEGNKLTLK